MSSVELKDDPLRFIIDCVSNNRIFWTYHVNMRMKDRFITRPMILRSTASFEIIESYPMDKYHPSYLLYASFEGTIFHVLFALDAENYNVRVITAYNPDKNQWDEEMKRRL